MSVGSDVATIVVSIMKYHFVMLVLRRFCTLLSTAEIQNKSFLVNVVACEVLASAYVVLQKGNVYSAGMK
jgi:hypothetical protein